MDKLSPHLLRWASILEDKTLEQAQTTATMPFIHPYVALMPDAHLGLGATVGSVIPTLRAIIPAAVGVDIGCGMMACRTTISASDLDLDDLATLRERIERAVPLGAGKYNDDLYDDTTQGRITQLWETEGVDHAED